MTAETTTSSPSEPALVSSDPLGDDLRRLAPVDGLLLRAEHLDAIQDYALTLTTGVGRGGGAGVDYGYLLTLEVRQAPDSGYALVVGPGLARSATGRPLTLTSGASIPLPAPGSIATGKSGVYVVGLVESSRPTGGVDQVIGNLCGDPCSGEGGFQPYQAEGVRIEVRPLDLGSVDTASPRDLRSALAEACFERERRRHGEPVPRTQNAVMAPASWSGDSKPPDPGEPVEIGLIYSTGTVWEHDTWSVRRDRMELPAHRWWFDRLGLRPLPAFLAQVLQFQEHLADVRPGSGTSLAAVGFRSLPPAGFLPVDPNHDVEGLIADRFDNAADLRFRAVPADEIGFFLEQARHRNRIPLTAGAGLATRVDVLVPDGFLDSDAETSTVQFARSGLSFTKATSGMVTNNAGLARMYRAARGPLRLATAATGTGVGNDQKTRGVWLDARLSVDPLTLVEEATCNVDLRFAGTSENPVSPAAVGGAQVRADANGMIFVCSTRRVDETSGRVVLDGNLSGLFRWRSGKTNLEEMPFDKTPVTVEIAREGGRVTATAKDPGGNDLVTVNAVSGGWPTSVHVAIGRLDITATLELDASAANVGSDSRKAAERAVTLLEGSEIPTVVEELLYAVADEQGSRRTLRTPHDWVFFTRRHESEVARG